MQKYWFFVAFPLFVYIAIVVEPTACMFLSFIICIGSNTSSYAYSSKAVIDKLFQPAFITRPQFVLHMAIFLLYNGMQMGVPIYYLGLFHGYIYALIPRFFFGIQWLFNTQIGHVHEKEIHADFEKDWYKDQCAHTANFGKANYVLYDLVSHGNSYKSFNHLPLYHGN
jgi:hypothetical protein